MHGWYVWVMMYDDEMREGWEIRIKVNQVNIIKENRGTNWINSIFSSFLEEEGRCLEKIRDYINLTQFNLIIRSGNTCNVFLAAILKKNLIAISFSRNRSVSFSLSLSLSLSLSNSKFKYRIEIMLSFVFISCESNE